MKDIGYYAGFLSSEDQEKITKADLPHLSLTLGELASCFADDYYYMDDSVQGAVSCLVSEAKLAKIGNRDRLSLIRGLCDRIEVKLMEEAK